MEPGTGRDSWQIRNAAGGLLSFEMAYDRAIAKRVKKETNLYSAVDPSVYRIYRYEQVIDFMRSQPSGIDRSQPSGIDRVQTDRLEVTIPELVEMFDGTEQLVGIARIP